MPRENETWHRETNDDQTQGRCPLTKFTGVVAFLLLSIASNARAGDASNEVILRTPGDASFQRLGVDASGAVIIIGDDQTSDYWRFFNDEFTQDALGDYTSAGNYVTGISRDARYVVGMTPLQDRGLSSGVVWPLATPSSPIMLPLIDGRRITDAVGVASSDDGPVVIGSAVGGAFLWSPAAGYTLWPATRDFRYVLLANSFDGQWMAGAYETARGEFQALAGHADHFIRLDDAGADYSTATAISSDGRQVCGFATFSGVYRGMVWSSDVRPILLEADTFLLAITDSGLAGGAVLSDRGIIYDPHGRKTIFFDEWWERNFPETPLPGPVTRVLDMYEHQSRLYLLLSIGSPVWDDYLAIIPFHTSPGRKTGQVAPWQE